MSVPARLKEIREESNLTQSETAKLSGFLQKDISKYESGKSKFIPEGYIQFWFKRGYEITWIYTGRQPKTYSLLDFKGDHGSFAKSVAKGISKSADLDAVVFYTVILAGVDREILGKDNSKIFEDALKRGFKKNLVINELISLGYLDNEKVDSIIISYLKAKSGKAKGKVKKSK